ncbi:MAG: outer membrane lipoprotein carrier protein LolA [Acidobacteriota bacterium]
MTIRHCSAGRLLTVALLCAAAAAVAEPAQPPPSALEPAALARKVQAHYDTVHDFEGAFTQTYEGGVLRTKTSERGTVTIKRPGKMRWVYTAPEKKEFVSDGVKIYAYFPADKQVMVSAAPTGADTTPALFLTGEANLVRDFDASATEVAGAAAGLVGLKLVAKRPDPDFEWLAVAVDPVTFQIRHLVALDRQGGRSSFAFTNLQENLGPPDTLFAFRVPKGVDVINGR